MKEILQLSQNGQNNILRKDVNVVTRGSSPSPVGDIAVVDVPTAEPSSQRPLLGSWMPPRCTMYLAHRDRKEHQRFSTRTANNNNTIFV